MEIGKAAELALLNVELEVVSMPAGEAPKDDELEDDREECIAAVRQVFSVLLVVKSDDCPMHKLQYNGNEIKLMTEPTPTTRFQQLPGAPTDTRIRLYAYYRGMISI